MALMDVAIDTKIVKNRRSLRFNNIDELLAEMDRLVEADRTGQLVRLGNWSLGQNLGHLATWVEFSFTGTPLQPPLIVKLIVRMRKKKFLAGAMPAGVKIPKVPGGTLGTEPMPTDQ